MTTGGKRDRLIHESIIQNLTAHLTSLGWFAGGRYHAPVTIVDEFPDDNAEVADNTLAVSLGDGGGADLELGNNDEIHELTIFCDFFAENDAVGRHLRGDIYEYFRANDQQPVYDYSDIGDPQFATVEILDDIEKRKPERAVNVWQKHWYVVSFTLVDERAYT
jgi:hypothetical protein